MRWATFVVAALFLSSCGSSRSAPGEVFPAQSVWSSPPRPRLRESADTNDANAYYLQGLGAIAFRPDTAAAAFYWVTQLDPWRADAYYARAVALMRTLWAYNRNAGVWLPRRELREREMSVIDSLNRFAYALNPYIDRRFDRLVGPPPGFVICDRVRDATSAGLCFMQYGDFEQSAQKLGVALKKDPKKISLHYVRAQALYQLGHFDSAAAELGVLADSLGNRQEKELTSFYVSRATIYYAQGMAYTQLQDTAAARAAYERALVEDLGFHMANVRLAGRALAAGDTSAGLRHLAQAVSVSSDDAPLRFFYGVALVNAKQPREAEEQFQRAIEINAYYAPPYLHLGALLEERDLGRAVRSYDKYLARVARRDSTRAWVLERLQALVRSP